MLAKSCGIMRASSILKLKNPFLMKIAARLNLSGEDLSFREGWLMLTQISEI
jgi:hypothetical protein